MIAPGLDVNLDHEPNRESQGCDVVTQSDSVGLGCGTLLRTSDDAANHGLTPRHAGAKVVSLNRQDVRQLRQSRPRTCSTTRGQPAVLEIVLAKHVRRCRIVASTLDGFWSFATTRPHARAPSETAARRKASIKSS